MQVMIQVIQFLLLSIGVVAVFAMPDEDAEMSFALYVGIALVTKIIAVVAFFLAYKIDKKYGREIN